MATKILNIEHDDSFDEIIELLEKNGNEFILIIPKSHKVFKDAHIIEALKNESDRLSKSITVVSSDNNIIEKASAIGFQTVGKRKKAKTTPVLLEPVKNKVTQIKSSITDQQKLKKGDDTDKEENTDTNNNEKNDKDEKIDLEVQEIDKSQEHVKHIEPDEHTENDEDRTAAISDFYERPARRFDAFSLAKSGKVKSKRKTLITILSILGGAALIFLLTILLSNAKITVNAQKEPFVVESLITIGENINKFDSQNGLLPGKLVEIERVLSENFNSSGEDLTEIKSIGKITIFNEFSSSSQVLVTTTRFETKDGLIFRTPKTITVPGAKLENGQLIPGKIKIEVIADKPGEKYNIESSDFTIPGFKGSPKFEKFYAKSDESMTGGFIGRAKIATKEDVEKAKKMLVDEMDEFLKIEMQKLVLDETVVFIPQLMKTDISFSDKSNEAGQPGEKFTIITYGKASSMFFKKDDLLKFIEERIKTKNIDLVLKKEIGINYDGLNFSNKTNELKGKISASGNAFYNLSDDSILADITGLNSERVKDYFSQKKGVEFTKVIISPFWKNSIPKNQDRIEINIVYE